METIITQIFAVKDRYYEIKEFIDSDILRGEDPDYKPQSSTVIFHDLIQIRKELSCLSLDLAKETGDAIRNHKASKSKLEITRYLKLKQFMSSGVKVTAAESLAKQETTDLLQDESDKEGIYMTNRLILNQVNEILASIKQDISIIKKEHETFSDRE